MRQSERNLGQCSLQKRLVDLCPTVFSDFFWPSILILSLRFLDAKSALVKKNGEIVKLHVARRDHAAKAAYDVDYRLLFNDANSYNKQEHPPHLRKQHGRDCSMTQEID